MVVVVKERVHHSGTEQAQRTTEFFSLRLCAISVSLW